MTTSAATPDPGAMLGAAAPRRRLWPVLRRGAGGAGAGGAGAGAPGGSRGGGGRGIPGRGMVITGGILLGVVVIAWLAAPLLAGWGAKEIDAASYLQPPSADHLLGTDNNGMDVWARILHSVPVDLGIAVASVTLAVVIGGIVGIFSGFIGGWFDDLLMRLTDILQAFPAFILALAVAALVGRSAVDLVLVLAVVYSPAYARLTRAEARLIRSMPYVDAAKVSGLGMVKLAFRHVLPNSLTPVRIIAPLNCGWAMLSLAGLSFVGLGIAVPNAEWGAMISLGLNDIAAGRWWTSVPPGIALLICVLAFSLIGEGLQERHTRSRS